MDSLPSPVSSPSLTPKELTSGQPSRKRQRSQSMLSDASSSSNKRSVAEGASVENRSPRADEMSTLTLSDPNQDIDAYMAEQGDGDMPDIISQPQGDPQLTEPASPITKLAAVDALKNTPMVIGDTWYLVARQWYKRWRKACTGEVDKEGGVSEKDLGPVDNSSLVDKDGNLVSAAIEGVDVEFVCASAWQFFVSWYGEPEFPLPRKVISRGIMEERSLELHPPRLKALILSKHATAVTGPPHPYVTVSSKDTVKGLLTALASTVGPWHDASVLSRVWKVAAEDLEGSQYPLSKLIPGGSTELLHDKGQTVEEALIEPYDAFVVEFQEGGKWLVDVPDESHKAVSVITPPEVPPPLFSSGDGFFDRMSFTSSGSKFNASAYRASLAGPSTLKAAAPITFGSSSTRKFTEEPGTLGLGNMGNTCFMNSALQCLAHCKELTDYFLYGVYKEELNPDNPLGMHGAIAEVFGALLQRIWDPSPPSSSFAPREFKQQLQRFAPQFSGYQQHDSQELVAFLLDGLHEDLNRIIKKPYVEKPDWEGGGDKELVELARKSWDGYMQRNDSVIVDLFQGQYQSTLVCPECEKVSITFDPFMYLTLPLPIQKKWRHTVYYIPWDLDKPHTKVPVEIGRDASFKDLRALMGRWMGAPAENLLTLEIFNHRFYKNLDDNLLCGEMSDNDIIVCFELPCNSQQGRTYKKQPDDPFILPLFLCDVMAFRYNTFSRGAMPFGYPSVVVIDRKQATSLDAMYDAVLERLERWTKNARDLYTWEAGSSGDAPIRINGLPLVDNPITEIKENGDVVEVQEEGDIVDEKLTVLEDDDIAMDNVAEIEPRRTSAKHDVFTLRMQTNHKDFGTALGYGGNIQRFESWELRVREAESEPVLLRESDAFFAEFDENMKAYYFGDERSHWEHARWDEWEEFVHPEYAEARKTSAAMKNKGISIQDCLDEFTHEEKLGEDDLWYCPRCKKHQQATKKFDLWKAPDVLVVHLKRFSNSRALRDKIDTFVDFPVTGLDLSDMVGERLIAKKLLAEGEDVNALGLSDLDEPLIYDLFGVDEHMGGLGGGHYRAYALNHLTEKWYHFDDSYVRTASAGDAVNSNAYLLFYRRRTDRPVGGKTHQKIEDARFHPKVTADPEPTPIDTQLPTPPNESTTVTSYLGTGMSRISALAQSKPAPWPEAFTSDSPPTSNHASPSSSPPPLDEADRPIFDDGHFENLDPLHIASQQFDFPSPSSNKASPASSVAGIDDDDDPLYEGARNGYRHMMNDTIRFSTPDSTEWHSPNRLDSPMGSDNNPFSDANAQKQVDGMDNREPDM